LKAEFDKDGILVILPENYLEAFALKHWYEDWHVVSDPIEECKSVLFIGTKFEKEENKNGRK